MLPPASRRGTAPSAAPSAAPSTSPPTADPRRSDAAVGPRTSQFPRTAGSSAFPAPPRASQIPPGPRISQFAAGPRSSQSAGAPQPLPQTGARNSGTSAIPGAQRSASPAPPPVFGPSFRPAPAIPSAPSARSADRASRTSILAEALDEMEGAAAAIDGTAAAIGSAAAAPPLAGRTTRTGLSSTAGAAGPCPVDARAASARGVLHAMLKAVRANQLYPRYSRIRKDTVRQLDAILAEHLRLHGDTEILVRHTEILSFGEIVYSEPDRQRSIAFRLHMAGVRSLRVLSGLQGDEAEGLADILSIALAPGAAAEEILAAAWERCFDHVVIDVVAEPLAADASAELGFAEAGRRNDRSAAGARAEAETTWTGLLAQPDPAEPDGAPVVLTPEERERLEDAVASEASRDLPAETAEFLLSSLDERGVGEVRAPLDDYFARLVATGDLRRAARMLAVLRDAAAASGSPSKSRALTEVVETIGRTRAAPLLGPLLDAAADADPQEREGISMLLAAIGEPAVAPLCALLGTTAHDQAMSALRMLAPRHPRPLSAFLSDARPEVVRGIVSLLATSRHPDAAEYLAPALRHGDAAVRRDALRAIAASHAPGTADILLGVLDDALYENRATALDALGAMRDPRVVAPLLRRIADRSFADASKYEKREIFRTLGRVGTQEATGALARILGTRGFLLGRDRQDELRCLAAAALGITPDGAARGVLMKHAEDGSESVRRAVQQALREIENRGV